jgi:hypothetical protein
VPCARTQRNVIFYEARYSRDCVKPGYTHFKPALTRCAAQLFTQLQTFFTLLLFYHLKNLPLLLLSDGCRQQQQWQTLFKCAQSFSECLQRERAREKCKNSF